MDGSDQKLLFEIAQKPLGMDRGSMSEYFADLFNRSGYGNVCLPHAGQLLLFANCTEQQTGYTNRMLNLFMVRLKEASWINPYHMSEFLTTIRSVIVPLCTSARSAKVAHVEQYLYDMLLTQFHELKKDPHATLHTLAETIVSTLEEAPEDQIKARTVSIIQDLCARLIWNPRDGDEFWAITLKICQQLHDLHTVGGLIDLATLNACLWAITHRLIHCIELADDLVPVSTYQKIQHDIAHAASPLFTVIDLEASLMKPRSAWLTDAVIAGETRARMVQNGNWITPREAL